jgi:TPR repeat protein
VTLFRIIICFLLFNKINAGEILSDVEYYNKGVSLYDEGAFDESFIVFFNLAEKGHKDSIFNLSNMYYEGVGTIQNFKQSLKYCWLCVLNGNKKCLKKVDIIKSKLSENVIEEIANQIPTILEKNFIEFNNSKSAFKLGFWFENFSPEIDYEQSYLWYSVSVSGGIYKAMKLRDRVGEEIETDKIVELQTKAEEIFTKNKYFNEGKQMEGDI